MSHEFYLWMSYGATAAALVVELALLRIGRVRALANVEMERELEAQD